MFVIANMNRFRSAWPWAIGATDVTTQVPPLAVRVSAGSLSKAEASEVDAVAWLVELAPDACGEEVAERADAPSGPWRVVSGEVGVEPCVGL